MFSLPARHDNGTPLSAASLALPPAGCGGTNHSCRRLPRSAGAAPPVRVAGPRWADRVSAECGRLPAGAGRPGGHRDATRRHRAAVVGHHPGHHGGRPRNGHTAARTVSGEWDARRFLEMGGLICIGVPYHIIGVNS